MINIFKWLQWHSANNGLDSHVSHGIYLFIWKTTKQSSFYSAPVRSRWTGPHRIRMTIDISTSVNDTFDIRDSFVSRGWMVSCFSYRTHTMWQKGGCVNYEALRGLDTHVPKGINRIYIKIKSSIIRMNHCLFHYCRSIWLHVWRTIYDHHKESSL